MELNHRTRACMPVLAKTTQAAPKGLEEESS